ncbi:FkbM family methyltransferase [Sulfolobus sp. A20-N-F6]|uniref:FkbM family methyltransferase n=1 Tax=Sulfolobus sp. B1 TaxID=2200888 RepID=UPI0009F63019|nr:FkbM family methyltransferase [Sulfolobus sp. B1]TRM74046.1 FkbM family methyltransferase [Sulfolobus sp. E5]TRM76012.1 FkbM family methyltransferase [Sulfolobus sp. B5]TRM80456.1 FkbM family methyltransferase [Sulfolobus sp. D5]TRM83548.1 FkbM family methyltransferase [Sulfolobus sp. A20-N-F6]TRM86713.1 FkbM family methyltransferase [Sulfolobus sp. C3]TRN02218.1 FkbM family methyltransferase [Sulfolobus sp. F1]TRN03895.1 FkbM family methyltransferase [Sulfolobus sp. E1]
MAIEPNPSYLEFLRKNLELNNVINVEVLPFAVGEIEGRMKFRLNGVTSSLSGEGIEVEVKPLDSLVSHADVIKMDIEGAEKYAIKSDVVKNAREIVMELHGRENVEFIPRYLREIGFEVREITYRDLRKNAIKNSILHLPSLLDAEIKTNFHATKVFLRRGRTSIPSVSHEEYKLIYAYNVSRD